MAYESNFFPKDLAELWTTGTAGESRPWLLLALFPTPSFFLQLLKSSRFESCSSFADCGSPERPVLCCLLRPKEWHWCCTSVEVRFQHIFEALLLAPSWTLAFYQFEYNISLGRRWSGICITWLLHWSWFLMMPASMLVAFSFCNTLTLALLSSKLTLRIFRRQLWWN